MDIEIDWLRIASVIELYKQGDYKYIEVPWKVPLFIQQITYPPLGDRQKSKIVGSAEQSFLYLHHLGKLEKGKYIACTPCVRKEQEYDRLHQNYFLKVELFQTTDVIVDSLNQMISDAFIVLSQFITNEDTLTTVKTEEGYDIELNGIEVGSYGIRSHNDLTWIYGTGLAEPRFSTALKIGAENHYKDYTHGT